MRIGLLGGICFRTFMVYLCTFLQSPWTRINIYQSEGKATFWKKKRSGHEPYENEDEKLVVSLPIGEPI